MGFLRKMQKSMVGVRIRKITGPRGIVRRCPDCHEVLQVELVGEIANCRTLVGMSCPKCGELYQEIAEKDMGALFDDPHSTVGERGSSK